jgi:AraC-like DNA-binding protein
MAGSEQAGANAPEPQRHGVFVGRRCHSDLAGLVDRITGYSEHGRALRGHVEAAPLAVPLVISFGDPFESALGRPPAATDRYGSFASGLYPGHVLINSTGGAECIQIDFTPLGARHFFNLPMREISGCMVHLDELGDAEVGRLRNRLGEERSWTLRLDLAEQFVRQRLARAGAGNLGGGVRWAYERILRARGDIRIDGLASALGCSRKHLVQRFNVEVGIGPKAFARMVRFNRALALARAAAAPDWVGIAVEWLRRPGAPGARVSRFRWLKPDRAAGRNDLRFVAVTFLQDDSARHDDNRRRV